MIDHLLALDPGRRGIASFFVKGGAAAAARALAGARRVLITTGFTVGDGLPETDGPPGAAALGRALRRLDCQVGYVTDAPTVPVLSAALGAIGEPAPIAIFSGDGDPAAEARRVLTEQAPSHLVSIERPGRTAGGDYLNARGLSVRPWNAPIDALFLRPGRRAVTVGVGDGGNEIGCGVIKDAVREIQPFGKDCGCPCHGGVGTVTECDVLVFAAVSNWGAYGIAAALAGHLGNREVLHDEATELRIVHASVAGGAMDGAYSRLIPYVDGTSDRVQASLITLLHQIVENGLKEYDRGF